MKKKQHGFTLIELLLVIAIIGIIASIAVPTYLDQRSKSRDAAAMSNCANLISEFASACGDARDQAIPFSSAAEFKTNLIGTSEKSMIPSLFNQKNPWRTAGALEAYNTNAIVTETDMDGTATKAAAQETNKGQVQIGYMSPGEEADSARAATIFLAVYLNKEQTKGQKDHVFVKKIGVD